MKLIMTSDNDCGAFVQAAVETALWVKEDLRIEDEYIKDICSERWVEVASKRLKDGRWKGFVSNELRVQMIEVDDWDDFIEQMADLTVTMADEVGMFNG